MKRLRLQTRMLLTVVLLTASVATFLDIAGVYIIRNYMMERFKGRITFLAKYLAVNSEVGVLIRDRAGLNSLAVNLLGEEDVALVTIFDGDNNILVEQSREIPGRLYMVETSVTLNKTDEENMLFTQYQDTPFGTLKIRGLENIGKVQIQYSTRGINRLMETVTKQFIMVSVLITMIAGILFYFMIRNIVTDVTKLVTVSKMIGSGNHDLRADKGTLPETQELAAAFNSMLDSLDNSRKAYERITKETAQQRSLAELGKFSLSVAHEVKNPLAIIKSAFDFLKKEYTIEKHNTMSQYIEDEILRLNRLIEDFLLFAKPGNIVFSNVHSDHFLEMLKDRCAMLYEKSPVPIDFDMSEQSNTIRADSSLLIRVFDNIIKNSVEASPENGTVVVRSYSEAGTWFVDIIDQGLGIEKGIEKQIFDPFFTTKSKGTGLGLALAHQIVKAHNGIMYAGNSDTGGAVFTIGIPII
ncbi:MAG: sensor histidine kinase [Desulfobacteraceae bacterium]|nr:MAG: sensor histidine kinase [Desulfobacteraceae bacterium]